MMIRMRRKGFTLVEIMIVVAIIGLLAAIAIPNFMKARQAAMKNACISNMKQIEGAIQVWAIDTGADDTATFIQNQIEPNYIRTWPKCGDTAYNVPANVSTRPTCPKGTAGHVLP